MMIVVIISLSSSQQLFTWSVLDASPLQSGRYEDLSFLNADTGWAVSGTSTLIRMINGGRTWDVLQAAAPFNIYFRCVNLVSPSKGFIGTLNAATPLIMTANKGKSFSAVTIAGKKPSKVCGLFRHADHFYGVGGYDGNATLIRSTDSGDSWTGIDMTPYAVSLVDCYFFNDSTGLTIGSAGGSAYNSGHTVVLRTTDYGTTWQTVYTSTRTKEWGWKLFFLNDSIGYVSIERRTPDVNGVYYLKTTDGGATWQENLFVKDFDVEGIGFWDESTGWIGGWTGPTYQTTDSGKSWTTFSHSEDLFNLNRVRRINDSLLFAAGTKIFKYGPASVTSVARSASKDDATLMTATNFPNPFNPNTTIQFTLSDAATVRIDIFNSIGQFIERIMDNPKPPGTYRLAWQPRRSMTSGVYFFRLTTERGVITHTMLLLR